MSRSIFAISLAVFFTALGLSGCAKKAVSTDVVVGMEEKAAAEPAKTPSPAVEEATAAPAAEPVKTPSPAVEEAPAAPAAEPLSDIFFDFDRYTIREDGMRALDKDAALLASDKNIRVVIEGHCDERGTDEYNIALGEKRAQAVKKYLTVRGVDPSRIKVVSYGNERPFCDVHDEECWQSNRRAHFVSQ